LYAFEIEAARERGRDSPDLVEVGAAVTVPPFVRQGWRSPFASYVRNICGCTPVSSAATEIA
jgi:hypothetical protein